MSFPNARHFSVALALVAVFLGGCATVPKSTGRKSLASAEASIHAARRARTPETAAGLYLDAAEMAEIAAGNARADSRMQAQARGDYNDAAAGLAALLRSSDGGRFWNRSETFTGPHGAYQLRFQQASRDGVWSPNYFTQFIPAKKINEKNMRQHFKRDGFGGVLVGVRKTGEERTDKEPFSPRVGTTAPVSATLDFQKQGAARKVTLTLNDPTKRSEARVNGARKPLAADFTAPLAYYPRRNELVAGFMAMIAVEEHLRQTGLYVLQPYYDERIPVIFVHGLASTPQMWTNDINELEGDPELRKHYQFWVFLYPTGNPLAYSSLRLREELAKAQARYRMQHGEVLVGHSMGGLLSDMQVKTTGRMLWDTVLRGHAGELYAKLPADSIVKRALIFDANPNVKRVVFICTPHRGSALAISTIGDLATKLISLPGSLVKTFESTLGSSFQVIASLTGSRIPTSIQSLSPKNPVLLALDKIPFRAPHHSIIGDRGRGDTPKSSDGVVPYWSSHLDSAQSELIVPGPHGSHELPQTVGELKRILRLNLQQPAPRDGSTKKARLDS